MSQYKVMGNFVYWDVPTAAQREALTPKPSEKYKVCYEQDSQALYLLISVNPITWKGIGVATEAPNIMHYDKVSDTVAYLGNAAPGSLDSSASWRIKKLTFATDGDVSTLFADGNSLFDNIWDARASLSYS